MGGAPARAEGMIDNLVLQLLERCWSKTPQERPSIVDVQRTLNYRPKVIYTPWSPSEIGELPGTLNLRVQSIKIGPGLDDRKRVFVKIKHGNKKYKTSPTKVRNKLGERRWFVFVPTLVAVLSLA